MKSLRIILPALLFTSMTMFGKPGVKVTNKATDKGGWGPAIYVTVDKAKEKDVMVPMNSSKFIETYEKGARAITWVEELFPGSKQTGNAYVFKTEPFKSPSDLTIYNRGRYEMKETMEKHPIKTAEIIKQPKKPLSVGDIINRDKFNPSHLDYLRDFMLGKIGVIADQDNLSYEEIILLQDMVKKYFSSIKGRKISDKK
jgi:hypothetical protein